MRGTLSTDYGRLRTFEFDLAVNHQASVDLASEYES